MPIEFRCSGCNQLLRVPETAVGQQAKCPNCSAVQTIPAASQLAPSAETAAAPPPPPPMFAGDSANPFAAPNPVGAYDYSSGMLDGLERNGPPWERDGKSFSSYWETFKLVLTDPAKMFSTMNRTAGLYPPIIFSLCSLIAGWLIFLVIMGGFVAVMAASKGAPGGDIMSVVSVFACFTVLAPLFAIAGLFIIAGILHLSLLIVGGARQPFETTFRVVAYISGCTNWISMIPYIGGMIAFVMLVVYSIFGVMHAHEITGGKATLAVLLPALCCCGLLVCGLGMMFFMVGIAAQN